MPKEPRAKKDVFGDKIKNEPKEPKAAAKPAPKPAAKLAAQPPASLLTAAQQKIATDMFAKYDLAKLTADQAKIILKVLETAGIHGPAIHDAAIAGGMDADKFLALAQGVAAKPPIPPTVN